MGYHKKTLERCIDCGILFMSGRAKRCAECAKAHASECAKKQWEDPKYREIMRTASKSNMNKLWEDPEYRQFMSDNTRLTMLERWSSDRDTLMANKGTKHCHDAKSAAAKKQWEDPEYRKFMSDNTRLQVRARWQNPDSTLYQSFYANATKFKPSSIEMKFKNMLDEVDIRYKQQFRPKGYHRVYDFLLLDYATLVEIDGKFWHHSPRAIARGAPIIDAEKDLWAVEHGYDIVRIPEKYVVSTIVSDWLIPVVLQGVC